MLHILREVGNIKAIKRIKIKREKLEPRYLKNFLELIVVITVAVALIMPGAALTVIEEKGEDTRNDTIINIFPYVQTVENNETFTVSVYVEPGERITGITIGKLSFNATLIQANSVTLESFFEPYNTTFSNGTIDNINGEITNIYETISSMNNVSNEGYFCNISFTAQQIYGISELELIGVIVADEGGSPAPIIVNNGNVLIQVKTIVNILPYAQTVKKNETFTISIYVGPGEPIIGVSFDYLYFDPAVIQVNSINEGGLFDPYTTIFNSGTIDNTNGTINNVYGFTDPVKNVTSMGVFCNISFTAQDAINTSPLNLEGVVITNVSGGEPTVTINNGKVAIIWSSTLYFNEPGGKNDYVIFGEATDANDGILDDYDIPKPPEPIPPYIRAWFDDGLTDPYDYLLKDCRRYNDIEKIWDLYVQWGSSSSNPVDITISWDSSEFDDSIYNCVVLLRYDPFDCEWDFVANMLTEEEYIYSPLHLGGWLFDHFQIITALDTTPPQITDVTLITSDPLDTIIGIGWELFSCTVTDNVVVDEVKLVSIGDTVIEYPMIKDGNDYSCNITMSTADVYSYHIWADDLIGNAGTSAPQDFELPLNEDVNVDGKVHFMDLVAVSIAYNDELDPPINGWVREDVNNDGKVHFMDLVAISIHYNEQWKP